MSSRTKNVFVIALITALVAVGGLSFFWYELRAQGVMLQEQVRILQENEMKESSYWRLRRLAEESTEKKEILTAHFFGAEEDSIGFLSEMEGLASNIGLSLKTESLDLVVDTEKKREYIKVVFSFEGRKDLVFAFADLMENVPYHSRVESLSLKELITGNWEGQLTILITINDYDK